MDDEDDADGDQSEETSGYSGVERLVFVNHDRDGGWGIKLRADLTSLLLLFCRKHAKAENPDVVTLKQALKLIDAFCEWRVMLSVHVYAAECMHASVVCVLCVVKKDCRLLA